MKNSTANKDLQHAATGNEKIQTELVIKYEQYCIVLRPVWRWMWDHGPLWQHICCSHSESGELHPAPPADGRRGHSYLRRGRSPIPLLLAERRIWNRWTYHAQVRLQHSHTYVSTDKTADVTTTLSLTEIVLSALKVLKWKAVLSFVPEVCHDL